MSDLIDRQYAIATAINGRTREIDGERWIRTSEVRESLKRCPTAQSNTPTDTPTDCISRQAAIDFIAAGHLCNPNEPRWSDNEIVNFLKSRPSAQPEPLTVNIDNELTKDECDRLKQVMRDSPILLLPSARRTGRWIFETLDGTPGYRPTVMFCSKCGRVSIADYSYCPNCGSRMEIKDHE